MHNKDKEDKLLLGLLGHPHADIPFSVYVLCFGVL